MVDGCAGRPARTGRFLAFDSPTSFIAGHTSAARGAGLRKLARTAPLKVLRGSRAEARGFPEHAFASQDRTAVIPGGTGVPVVLQPILKLLVVPNGGTGGTAMEDCRQPWAHWSHLSVPPVRANSCGVPPVPPVPPEETVRRNEDGIWNHDGSLSRGRLQGTGRRPRPRGLIPLPPCLLLAKPPFAWPAEGPSDRIARPGAPTAATSPAYAGPARCATGSPRRRFEDPAQRCGSL